MLSIASRGPARLLRQVALALALGVTALLAPGASGAWAQDAAAPATSAPVLSAPAPAPASAPAANPPAAAAPAAPVPSPAASQASAPLPPTPSATTTPAPGPARPAAGMAAGGGKHLFRLESALPGTGSAVAVAINADESILAVAREDGSTLEIALFDRPSHTRIGLISAKVGGQPRLAFAPDQDRLLVAGTKAIQLWDVPIVPLKPDKALDEKYRLWSQAVSGGATPLIAFGDPPSQVLWSQGAALFRREASAGGAPADKPAWRTDGADRVERGLSGFAFARGGAGLAVTYAGDKGVDLLDTRALSLLGSLQGHRFPVAGAVPQPKGWLSLDTGWHLMRWSESLQPQESVFLEALPRTAEPTGLAPLGPKHILIEVPAGGGAQGGGVQGWVTSAPAWRLEDKLSVTAGGLAISPTGRYVLAIEGAQSEDVKLYGFAAPEAPLDYVRRLQGAKAYRVAQGYVRLLDETGLSAKAKAALLSELGQIPLSVKAQDFQERLARARRDGNPDAIAHWAREVLALRPQDPDALAAQQDLKTLGQRRILDQAREAIKRNETAQAIAVLSSQIPADSAVYDEAAALIRQAEAQRRVAGLVGQAREQLNLGNVPAATALAEQALREDGDNAAARSLLAEIEDRTGTRLVPRWVPIGAGMAIALAGLGILLYRNRGRWMAMFRKSEPAAASSWGGRGSLDPLGAPPGPRASPSGTSAAGPRPRPRPPAGAAARESAHAARPARRPERADGAHPPSPSGERGIERPSERGRPARLQAVEDLLRRTEDLVRLAQQADVNREHTGRLMEWEAEVAAIHRRLADPAVELGPIHGRLTAIDTALRQLKFSRREASPAKGRPAPETVPNWYEVLRVSETASDAEIRASYHQLLKQYHPDLHNDSGFPWVREQADKITRQIGAAYQALGSAEKRQSYDRELRRRRDGGT